MRLLPTEHTEITELAVPVFIIIVTLHINSYHATNREQWKRCTIQVERRSRQASWVDFQPFAKPNCTTKHLLVTGLARQQVIGSSNRFLRWLIYAGSSKVNISFDV